MNNFLLKLRQEPALMFLFGIMVPITIFLVMQLFNDPDLFFQTLMKALAMGSTYAIVALGFVLIFKATQVVNFAQGSLAVSGALFLSFLVADDHIPFTTIDNPINSLPGPDWIHWGVSRSRHGLRRHPRLGDRAPDDPSDGRSAVVLGGGDHARARDRLPHVFNNDTVKVEFRNVEVPWGIDGFNVGKETINYSIIAAMVTAFIAFVAVFIFYRSRLGIAMRAVAFDQEAAMAQGINVGRVFAIAWAAGAVLAMIGGVFATQPPVKQSLAVDNETANIAFRALPAVILGGLDSATGALLGGMIIGAAEIFAGQYAAGETDILGAGYPSSFPTS